MLIILLSTISDSRLVICSSIASLSMYSAIVFLSLSAYISWRFNLHLPLPTLDFYRLVNIDTVLELGLVDHLYKLQESFCPLTYITMYAVGAYRFDCAFSHHFLLSAVRASASDESAFRGSKRTSNLTLCMCRQSYPHVHYTRLPLP